MIAQRRGVIGVPDHACQFLHMSREAIGPIRYAFEIHPSPSTSDEPRQMSDSPLRSDAVLTQ
jgi:hypothetical protein